MKKIIVTGGTGYIGSHTVVELLETGFEVAVVDSLFNSTENVIHSIEKITGKKLFFDKVDLANEQEAKDYFNKHNDAVAIINFASHKAVGESVKDPLKYYKNNLNVIINCLTEAKVNGISNFVFSSSATVYGLPDKLPLTEDMEAKRPTSPYGNVKKISEEILEDVCAVNPDFNTISLRYFNPIGAHDSGLIGENPKGIPDNLMPYITQTAIGKREKLMVYGDNYPTRDGTPIRDYIHVVDLAKAHVKTLERLLNKQQDSNFEIFNIGTGIGSTVLEIIQSFENATGVKVNYEITSPRAGDVPILQAAIDLAEHKLNWKATRTLEEMMLSAWQWEQNAKSVI